MRTRVKYFPVSRRRDVLPVLNQIKTYFSSVKTLILVGDPLSLIGNEVILIYRAPFNTNIKIDGAKKVVYIIRYIIDEIIKGNLSETDEQSIREIVVTY